MAQSYMYGESAIWSYSHHLYTKLHLIKYASRSFQRCFPIPCCISETLEIKLQLSEITQSIVFFWGGGHQSFRGSISPNLAEFYKSGHHHTVEHVAMFGDKRPWRLDIENRKKI